MAELLVRERLQPSLLDRLVDEEPSSKVESRDRRMLSFARLRECVVRDLGWLLNTVCLSVSQDLEPYPEVQRSVLNFGIPDLTGRVPTGADVAGIEQSVRQAIIDFEPRLLRDTLKVNVRVQRWRADNRVLQFTVQAHLWAQPVPLDVRFRSEVDVDTGAATIVEASG